MTTLQDITVLQQAVFRLESKIESLASLIDALLTRVDALNEKFDEYEGQSLSLFIEDLGIRLSFSHITSA